MVHGPDDPRVRHPRRGAGRGAGGTVAPSTRRGREAAARGGLGGDALVDSIAEAATLGPRRHRDPFAGPGAPLVAEFAVAELAAALGLSTEAGRGYLAEAVELRYRLPRVWSRVTDGDLAAWRARRIAAATIALSAEAAGWVDTQVAHVAHKIGAGPLGRLVEEAIARFMPDEAEKRRQPAADGRHFTIDTRDTSLAGTSRCAASSTSPTPSTSTPPSPPAPSS